MNEILTLLANTPGMPGDLTALLQHIAEIALKAFEAEACAILAFNPITEGFVDSVLVTSDTAQTFQALLEEPKLDGISRQLLKSGLLLIEDLDKKPQYHSAFTQRAGIRAFAGLALHTRHRKRALGVIYIDFKHPKEFSATKRDELQVFAIQASLLLQETWLAYNYKKIAHIGQDANQNLGTVSDLFQELQTYIDAILDDNHTILLAVHQVSNDTLDVFIHEKKRFILKNVPMNGACQYVIRSQQQVFIKQLSQEAEHLPFQIADVAGTMERESFIFVPIQLRHNVLGVLSIQHSHPNAYGREDLFILQVMANHTGLALHNMRLYNNLKQLNEVGQILTQQLESQHALSEINKKILDGVGADVAVLYLYDSVRQQFLFPAYLTGTLVDEVSIQITSSSSFVFITDFLLNNTPPRFIRDSYTYSIEQREHQDFQQREKIRSTAILSLRLGDEAVGVLFLYFRQPQRFDATQKLFIEGIVHFAANALKNAQVFGIMSLRRVRELEILQYISNELNRNLSLEAVLNTLLKLATEQVPADSATISLYNPQSRMLVTAAAIGDQAIARRKMSIALHETVGITRWVLENKLPTRVDDVHHDLPWRDIYIQSSYNTKSELDVPLLDGEEIVGVLNFESHREGAFHQEDQDFLVTLAGQTVLAIKKAQAYEREIGFAKEAQALNKIGKEITGQLDIDHAFNLILDKALELTNSTLGALMLYDTTNHDLWMAAERGAAEGKKDMRVPLDRGIVGYVATHKECVNVDPTQEPWSSFYVEFIAGTRSELAVPMLAGDDIHGVLNIESPLPDHFSESDLRVLKGLADLAVIALQNALAYDREKRLATEAQTLNEISKEISSQLDSIRIFELILDKALDLTHSTTGSLELYDAVQNNLRIAAERGVAPEKRKQRLGLDEGIVGYALRNRKLINVNNVFQTPWKELYLDFIPGSCSELVVPMLAGETLRGVINIESPKPDNFSKRDEFLLQGLADLAVITLQNAERYQQAERDAKRFALLYQAGQELSELTELLQLENAYDVTLDIAKEYSQSHVVIRSYDEHAQELVVIRTSEYLRSTLLSRSTIFAGVNGQVAHELHTIVIDDTFNPPPHVESNQLNNPDIRSLLITPIRFKEHFYGTLALGHENVGYFQSTDENFLEALAQQLATTIYRLETAQARREYEKRALSAEEMSSIGHLAYELTHRLGNDLGLVESYVDDIRSELETLDVKNDFIGGKFDRIVRAARRVLALNKDLKLVMTKLGEAIMDEPVVLHPRDLLEKVLEDFQELLVRHNNIEVYLDTEDTAMIQVVPASIHDILRNLLTNAIEAIPEGGRIVLRTHKVGRFLALEVSDTGIGIPPAMQSKVFELSFSTKGSSGFGLWSARRNALRNRGDLKVESKQGQGTTFTLLLPRIDAGGIQ